MLYSPSFEIDSQSIHKLVAVCAAGTGMVLVGQASKTIIVLPLTCRWRGSDGVQAMQSDVVEAIHRVEGGNVRT